MNASFLLLFSVLAGGGAIDPANADAVAPPGTVRMHVVFDEKGGKSLEGLQFAAPDTDPPLAGFDLTERANGRVRWLADRVGAAAYAPDGAILFVQGEELIELKGEHRRRITAPVMSDFACNASCSVLAVVRPDPRPPESTVELVGRDGTPRGVLARGGWNGFPTFLPDGQALVYVSSVTGVASHFRVGLTGAGRKQLTNLGLQPTDLAAGVRATPVPGRRRGMRFRDGQTLSFESGKERWSVDVGSGASKKEVAQ